MPHHIDRLYIHTEQKGKCHKTIADLVVCLYLLVHEEQRNENECENAAVYLRSSVEASALVNVYRVILVREQTRNKLDRIEHSSVAVIRDREIEFTECKCVVDRQYHNDAAQQYNYGRYHHKTDGLCVFLNALEFALCSEEQVVYKVQRDENGYHKADIEVSDEHYRCRYDVIQLSAVINEVFHAEDYKRQEYRTVDPHRVDELDNNVCHHSIHCREHDGLKRFQSL